MADFGETFNRRLHYYEEDGLLDENIISELIHEAVLEINPLTNEFITWFPETATAIVNILTKYFSSENRQSLDNLDVMEQDINRMGLLSDILDDLEEWTALRIRRSDTMGIVPSSF